jgi:hypothetical protein
MKLWKNVMNETRKNTLLTFLLKESRLKRVLNDIFAGPADTVVTVNLVASVV